MMNLEFETAQEMAVRLGVTPRAVQKWAASGRLPGAIRHGRAWMIPKDAMPLTAQEMSSAVPNGIPDVYQLTPFRLAMPLFNSAYPVGRAREHIDAMPDADDRQIALAEHRLFAGEAEEAARIAEPYMVSHDPGLRFSANLICAFANLGRGHSHLAKFAMMNLSEQTDAVINSAAPAQIQALAIFAVNLISVDFRLSQADALPMEKYLSSLPDGFRQYACCRLPTRHIWRRITASA